MNLASIVRKSRSSLIEQVFESQLKRENINNYVREFVIPSGPRKFRYDFAWQAEGLLVEIQGGLWMLAGGHNTAAGIKRDMDKLNYAQAHGYRCLQVSSDMIFSHNRENYAALELIRLHLASKGQLIGPKTD